MTAELTLAQEPMGLKRATDEVASLLRSMPIDARIADVGAHVRAFAEELQRYPLDVWREALSPLRRNPRGVAPSIGAACSECEVILERRSMRERKQLKPAPGLAELAVRQQRQDEAKKRREEPHQLASRAILSYFGRGEWQEWAGGFAAKEAPAIAVVNFMAIVHKAEPLLRRDDHSKKAWCAIINAATIDPAEAETLLRAPPAVTDAATDADVAAATAAIIARYYGITGRAATPVAPSTPLAAAPKGVGTMRHVAEEAARICAAAAALRQSEDSAVATELRTVTPAA